MEDLYEVGFDRDDLSTEENLFISDVSHRNYNILLLLVLYLHVIVTFSFELILLRPEQQSCVINALVLCTL